MLNTCLTRLGCRIRQLGIPTSSPGLDSIDYIARGIASVTSLHIALLLNDTLSLQKKKDKVARCEGKSEKSPENIP